MASIQERNNKFCVVYYVTVDGVKKQKWETYDKKSDAKKRKKEIEYQQEQGIFIVPKCKNVRELMNEYVELYGQEKWALSTYQANTGVINNYIIPLLGDVKLTDIDVRYLELFYKQLLKTPAVVHPLKGKKQNKYVGLGTIRDIHKLLKSCFKQAVKWQLMISNPATLATVPQYKEKKRDIWNAETLMHALEVCEDEYLKLAINLAFAGSLRIGELLGLTWDCVEISKEAIRKNVAYISVEKEIQRVSKEALKKTDAKDVLFIFPENSKTGKTVLVLKKPKTESSVRKIFIPQSVANMLVEWKKLQDEKKEVLGEEYYDYNLVMPTNFGTPVDAGHIRTKFTKLIEDNDLPVVVFHSLRHSSITYKLKLNGGDIKAVQGDSGHAQTDMITETYAHIIDDDRKKNAALFEEAFYGKKNLDPQISGRESIALENMDQELLEKVLQNPDMLAYIATLAKKLNIAIS